MHTSFGARSAAACFAIVAGLAIGAEAPRNDDPTSLVRSLGAASFRTRENAEQELRALGSAAIAALETGLAEADDEIRGRCQRLLLTLRRSPADVELDDFVANNALTKSAAFAAWPAFSKIAGGDRDARAIYAAGCRSNPELLKLAHSNAKQAGTQIIAQCARITMKEETPEADPLHHLGQVAAVLFAACQAPAAVDANVLNHLQNVLTRPEFQMLAKGHRVFARLVENILEQQPRNQQTFHQRFYLAKTLELADVLERTIQPEVRKQLAEAAKNPDNINQLQSVVYLAKQVGLEEDIQETLMPALLKAAERAAKQVDQPDQFFTVFNLLQTLQMGDAMERVMKPAFQKMLRNEKLLDNNSSRVYQLASVAKMLNLDAEARAILQPALRRRMLAALHNPTEQEVSRLYYEAQYLGMQESVENLLMPAAHRLIMVTLEKSLEVHTLQRMVAVAQMFSLLETTEKTLKPVVRQQIKAAAGGAGELWSLNQFYHLARSLSLNEAVDEDIKPRVIALIKQSESKGLEPQMFDPIFHMAMTMELKEALPLAMIAALDRKFNSARRARAIQYAGRVGGRGEIDKLATLLDDRTSVGSTAWNSMRINTEVRDVALAAMVHITKQRLADYGFDYAQFTRADFASLSYTHLGFSSEQRRASAHARWQQWANKK